MPVYCAFLGHQPHISLAELCVLLPDLKVQRFWNLQILTFETAVKLDQEFLRNVGGIVLLALQLTSTLPPARRPTPLQTLIQPLLVKELADVKRKATFSFRCFGIPRQEIRSLYRSCKTYLKGKGIPSRYIGNERHPAKPGTLLLRGIPGPGCAELVILRNERQGPHSAQPLRRRSWAPRGEKGEVLAPRSSPQASEVVLAPRSSPQGSEVVLAPRSSPQGSEVVWVGATCAVQDIEAYTERDMGKPYRDTRTGLMPPKLAQIMLNLGLLALKRAAPRTKGGTGEGTASGLALNRSPERSRRTTGSGPTSSQPKNQKQKPENLWEGVTVWDPFCGSGVIALEALLRRAHVLASDRSERAVRGCERNIAWLRAREKTPKVVTHHVWKQNALHRSAATGAGQALPRTPTLIVTETSLGPALTRPPTKADIKKLLREAEELELRFFSALVATLPTIPIVATFPVYIARDGTRHFLPHVLQEIASLGYRLTFPANKAIRMTDRHTLLYLRPDQHIGREIVCLLAPPRSRAGIA